MGRHTGTDFLTVSQSNMRIMYIMLNYSYNCHEDRTTGRPALRLPVLWSRSSSQSIWSAR
jgi:hypothetical protein